MIKVSLLSIDIIWVVTVCLLSISMIDFKGMISVEYCPFSVSHSEWIHESFPKTINEITLNWSSYLEVMLTKHYLLANCWEYGIIGAQPNYLEGKRIEIIWKFIWGRLHRKTKIGIWILGKSIHILEESLRPLESRFIWVHKFECKIHKT